MLTLAANERNFPFDRIQQARVGRGSDASRGHGRPTTGQNHCAEVLGTFPENASQDFAQRLVACPVGRMPARFRGSSNVFTAVVD